MKKIPEFLSENFQFLVLKFSIYLNRRVFAMCFENIEIKGEIAPNEPVHIFFGYIDG